MSKQPPPDDPQQPQNAEQDAQQAEQDVQNIQDAKKARSTTEDEQANTLPAGSEVISLEAAAHAKRHEQKAKRMANMQNAFERFMPINKESRQTKRLKARKKKKGKKKK